MRTQGSMRQGTPAQPLAATRTVREGHCTLMSLDSRPNQAARKRQAARSTQTAGHRLGCLPAKVFDVGGGTWGRQGKEGPASGGVDASPVGALQLAGMHSGDEADADVAVITLPLAFSRACDLIPDCRRGQRPEDLRIGLQG